MKFSRSFKSSTILKNFFINKVLIFSRLDYLLSKIFFKDLEIFVKMLLKNITLFFKHLSYYVDYYNITSIAKILDLFF